MLDNTNNLTPELPKDLIYWYRTKTEVVNTDFINNEQLNDFYDTEFKWHEDLDGEVGRVSDVLPFFRDMPIWIDNEVQYGNKRRYINRAEHRILTENKWIQGMMQYPIEGKIMIAKPTPRSVFFNAKFETGNLR